ncbi:unnamed protein product, partial [Rotaria sp. Silwood1]
ADTKGAFIAGEKAAEEKLAAAKHTVLEKSSELVHSAKHAAHDANVKAHELGHTVEQKVESAEKIAEQKFEQSKHAVSEKASEAKAKGAGILGATHHALATGAAIVSEKVKH